MMGGVLCEVKYKEREWEKASSVPQPVRIKDGHSKLSSNMHADNHKVRQPPNPPEFTKTSPDSSSWWHTPGALSPPPIPLSRQSSEISGYTHTHE